MFVHNNSKHGRKIRRLDGPDGSIYPVSTLVPQVQYTCTEPVYSTLEQYRTGVQYTCTVHLNSTEPVYIKILQYFSIEAPYSKVQLYSTVV